MRTDIPDLARLIIASVGVALVGYGAWLHYAPLGFVLAGAMLFGVAVVGALRVR